MRRSCSWTVWWSMLLACWTTPTGLCAQNVAISQALASFSNVTILPELRRNGLQGVGISYQLTGDIARTDGVNLSKIGPQWAITCTLYDENRFPLLAATGTQLRTADGRVQDSLALGYRELEKALKRDTLFIPYHAIASEPGSHRVFASLRLTDLQTRELRGAADYQAGMLQKPPLRMVRLQTDRIFVLPTNAKGESWDYKIFNQKEIGPDLFWTVRRGSELVFESRSQKNDTSYVGNPADRTEWFFISRGDKLNLQVLDFDLLGSSDLVGQLALDLEQQSFATGVSYDFHFGQVKEQKLQIEVAVPPKPLITNYEILENQKEKGLSGVRLRMTYDQQQIMRGCEFQLGIALRTPQGDRALRHPRVIGPGGIPSGAGTIVLTGGQSDLELFLPHYDLRGVDWDWPLHLRLDLIAKVDGQSMAVGSIERQVQLDKTAPQDIFFGQWKMGVQDRYGEGGMQFSVDYTLPDGYFQDLPESKLLLEPALFSPWGEILNSNLVVSPEQQPNWKDNALQLTKANKTGTLDFFLPFHKCEIAAGKAKFAMDYLCKMTIGAEQYDLGKQHFEAEIELPQLRELHLEVKEAAVKRTKWMLSDPSLYWVAKIGETEIFRSPVVRKARVAHWPEASEAHAVVSENDIFQVLVIHKGSAGEPDRILETWKVPASEIPDKPKGNTRLRPNVLRRLIIHSFWVN